MKIPQSHIGRFTSTAEAQVYRKAEALKFQIEESADFALQYDNVKGKDLDDLVPAKVEFTSLSRKWGYSGTESGVVEFKDGQLKAMDVRHKAVFPTNNRHLVVKSDADKTSYSSTLLGCGRELNLDRTSGDWEVHRIFFGIRV